MSALPRLTWRKFLVLLRGLSSASATVVAAASRVEFGSTGERVKAVEGPEAAQAAFVTLFRRG